jgi:hypothetical protein
VSVLVAAASFAAPAIAQEPDAARLFGRYKDRIVQIRVVNVEAETKSALGTGFLVDRHHLVATNYHVISQYVDHPDRYRLEHLDEEGEAGDLVLLDVDVVHDLALLRADDLAGAPLELLGTPPDQGDTIYSLGNPLDIGFTVIPGTYNGIAEGSYYEHIHFSGSINAGMSGGPVLDRSGEVVGINVASAGNQVSFLVPGSALSALIEEGRAREQPISDFRERIREQLYANQREFMERVLGEEWPSQELGEATAVGEIEPFVKCWGDSSEEDTLYKLVATSCRSEQAIFLRRGFTTGVLAYQFFWLEANELEDPRFQSYYQTLFESIRPDNYAGEDDVGKFVCEERFVTDDADHTDKAVVCVRAYKEYAGLYDALYVRGSVDEPDKAFTSHFSLAGAGRELIAAFLERFQRVARR